MKKIIITTFIFSFMFLGLGCSLVYAETETKLEELKSQKERVEKMRTTISSLFVLAEKSDQREAIEDALSDVLARVGSIEKKIKKEISELRKEVYSEPTFAEAVEVAKYIEYRNGVEPSLLLSIMQKWHDYKRMVGKSKEDIPKEWETYSDVSKESYSFTEQARLLGDCLEDKKEAIGECFSEPKESLKYGNTTAWFFREETILNNANRIENEIIILENKE